MTHLTKLQQRSSSDGNSKKKIIDANGLSCNAPLHLNAKGPKSSQLPCEIFNFFLHKMTVYENGLIPIVQILNPLPSCFFFRVYKLNIQLPYGYANMV